MKVVRRAFVAVSTATLLTLVFAGPSRADAVTCFVSATSVPQGGSITVSGSGNVANEVLFAIMDGTTQVGSGVAGAVAPFNYSFTVTIPATTTAPATHTLLVRNAVGPGAPCPNILVTQAAPTPSPTVPPTPTPRRDDDIADALRALAAAGRGGGQQQQQEQAINFPVAAPIPVGFTRGGGSSLPKTGVDVAEVGGLGTLSLLTGVSLVEFARRRRRHWLVPAPAAVATEVVSDHVPVAPAPVVEPVLVGGEADLLLPYIGPRPLDPDDFITPSF